MSKNSVSEWSTVSSGNGDIAGLTLGLNMPPSYVNNSIQEMMAQIKQWKDGYTDPITGLPVYQSIAVENISVEGIANFKGSITLDGNQGNLGQVLVSSGSSETPTWGSGFPTGGIILWSGSTGSIPSGWALCNGDSGTPNLTDRFVVGAGSTYDVNATGGSADTIIPSHTHTATSSVTDPGHTHTLTGYCRPGASGLGAGQSGNWNGTKVSTSTKTGISVATDVSTVGEEVENKNLPPYYALCYIMKL